MIHQIHQTVSPPHILVIWLVFPGIYSSIFAKHYYCQTFLLYGMSFFTCLWLDLRNSGFHAQLLIFISTKLNYVFEVLYLGKENRCLDAICHNSVTIHSLSMELTIEWIGSWVSSQLFAGIANTTSTSVRVKWVRSHEMTA